MACCVEGVPPSNRGQDARDTVIPKALGLEAATQTFKFDI
jgi:hypothetical protein